MTDTFKPLKRSTAKKQAASMAGRALSGQKAATTSAKPSISAKRGEYTVIGSIQLRQADKMLKRIERKGEALSASADKLLRRVS